MRRGVVAIVTSLALLVVAGCGLRLETPPPTEPVPDAQETLRRVAVEGALLVGDLADAAAATSSGLDQAALDALTSTSTSADEHVTQLGGVYDSGLPEPDQDGDAPTSGATDAPTGPTTATPAEVVDALATSATALRGTADQSEDGAFARLVASVAASQDASARQVAATTGTALPDPLVTPAGLLVPEAAPSGLSATDLSTIIEAEDAAGYAFELRAALADGELRDAALGRAVLHRARAEAWAQAAGTAGGPQDPRRVAYTVPPDVPTPELAAQLETSLAQSYAALTGEAGTGTRLPLVDLLVEANLAAIGWGAPVSAFPGLPEQESRTPAAG
ncbi:DUF4439 domain-containing protein [Oerskovia paurometabola]|uniref:DUF4439 domain-containing protein n=1 Tax=Oerskovia paurometabola TaxID=162170 RepID=A0ABW1XEP3_9CELL|nr:DUF4439 domain-containing protein [Oerskovia paurometabola]MBM7496971.1 hypothetical protein [Oerskovia paurometabola]